MEPIIKKTSHTLLLVARRRSVNIEKTSKKNIFLKKNLFQGCDAMETVKKQSSPSVRDLFESMEYGPAPESDKVIQY